MLAKRAAPHKAIPSKKYLEHHNPNPLPGPHPSSPTHPSTRRAEIIFSTRMGGPNQRNIPQHPVLVGGKLVLLALTYVSGSPHLCVWPPVVAPTFRLGFGALAVGMELSGR